MKRKQFFLCSFIVFSLFFIMGCGRKDTTQETLDSIKISMENDILLAYDVDIDTSKNIITLKEDEYKTPYLKLEEQDEVEFMAVYGMFRIMNSIINMDEQSADIRVVDQFGEPYIEFNNEKVKYERNKEFGNTEYLKTISKDINKNRDVDSLVDYLEEYDYNIETNKKQNEIKINLDSDGSPWNVLFIRSLIYEKAPRDLTVKLFNDEKTKLAELKYNSIVNFNQEIFDESDFEEEYKRNALEDYHDEVDGIHEELGIPVESEEE
ncbi:hypothetical protein [Vagococcus fluvialis]|uniref:hypothetical protein n=1 Tax=Vagococcus fluvialis TaxID=2738 RepID=UPI003B5CAB8D